MYQIFPEWSAYPQSSALDEIHLSSRSRQEHQHILLIVLQSPVQSHDIRYRQTFCLVHAQYLLCFLFYQSVNQTDPSRSHAYPDHVLPLQRSNVFSYLSFQRLKQYSCLSYHHVLSRFSFFPLIPRITQSDSESLRV